MGIGFRKGRFGANGTLRISRDFKGKISARGLLLGEVLRIIVPLK